MVYDAGSPLDPVNGAKLAGTQHVAELYAGTDAMNLAPLTASISRFRSTTTLNRGKWGALTIYGQPNTQTILPYPPGSTVTLMVKVWDYSQFQTYEEAEAARGATGASALFSYPNWRATGPPFVAQSEVVENEFDVAAVEQFFRVQEVE